MAERILSVRLRAITDAYERGMDRAAASTERMADRADRLANVGSSITSSMNRSQLAEIGSSITMGVTVPLAAVGTVAAKSAIGFESAFAGVEKTVDATTGQLAGMRQGIIDMANSIPATREQIAGVAQAAGQLGIETDSILGFTRVMIDLGESTDLTAEQAATSLAQLANITQMPQTEFSRLGSSVVALGNNMATTESRIVDMALRIASAGTAVGLTEADIVGFAASLSSVGIEAEAGGTAMSRVLITIASAVDAGGSKLEQFARVAGVSGAEFAEAFRSAPAQAVAEFVAGMGRLEESGQSMFAVMDELALGDVRVGNALRSMAGAGDLLSDALSLSSGAWSENTALAEEAAKRYGTTESRLRTMLNRITDLGRKTGEALVPALLAVVGVLDPIVSGLGGVAEAAANAPRPLQLVGGSILGIALAAGPTIWAFGKLIDLAGPVIAGFQSMLGAVQGFRLQLHLAAMSGMTTTQALAAMLGPQALVIAALTAAAGTAILVQRENDRMAASHRSAGQMATALGDSVGIATQDITELAQALDDASNSGDGFRRANQEAIDTLRGFGRAETTEAVLLEIGYQFVLRGGTPEQAVEQVTALAKAAGIEVPASLTVDNVGDFENQVRAARERARDIMSAEGDEPISFWEGMTVDSPLLPDFLASNLPGRLRETRIELDNIAQSANDALATQGAAGFVQVLAAAEVELEGNADAYGYLADQALRYTDASGLHLSKTTDLASGLRELTSEQSKLGAAQKAELSSIMATAEAMDGGLTPANLAAAAAVETAGFSASQFGDKVAAAEAAATGAAGAVGELGDASGDAGSATVDFAAQLDKMAAKARMSTLDLDAAAAAAQAYADSIEASTSVDDTLASGLGAGRAARQLREGMTGQQRLADAAEETKERIDEAASSVDRLGDAAAGLDPKFSAASIAMGSLDAAASAFRSSLEDSSWLDDQIDAAMGLGDAFEEFRRSARRLPGDLNMVDISMGDLNKRQTESVRKLLSLGKASTDYLGTLLEMGRGEAEVRSEAERMRREYENVLRQVGLNEAQVARYIEMLGLTPEQVNTAIELSGAEAARFQLQSYLQLLQGKIPGEVASSVIAKIEGGDISGAAGQLAQWAKTNPVNIEVTPKVNDSGYADKVAEIKASLWRLPKDLDPLKAALGGYDDATMDALDAVQRLGDGYQDYLSKVIASGAPEAEIERQAEAIQEAFRQQLAGYGIVGDAANDYLELVGLSDWQIDSAITVSGEAEATAKLQAFMETAELVGAPREIQVAVAKAQMDGDLQGAADIIDRWWQDQHDGFIDDPLVAEIMGSTDAAQQRIDALKNQFPLLGTLGVDADTEPAKTGLQLLHESIPWFGGTVGVDSDTEPAETGLETLHNMIPMFGGVVRVDADTEPAMRRLAQLQQAFPIFGNGLIPTGPDNRIRVGWDGGWLGGGTDGDPDTPYAAGGLVRGPGTGTSDSIRARISNGEFVVKASSVRSIGADTLDQMNRTGTIPGTTIPVAAGLIGAGGFDDSRIVGRLDKLETALRNAQGDVSITVERLESPNPGRSAEDLLIRGAAVAQVAGLR